MTDWGSLAIALRAAQEEGHQQMCLSCGAGCDELGIGEHAPLCAHPAAGARTRLDRAKLALAPRDVEPAALDLWRAAVHHPGTLEHHVALWLLALLPVYRAAVALGAASNAPGEGLGSQPWVDAYNALFETLE